MNLPVEPEKLSKRQFELFRDFIYRHSGIRVDAAKITLASNRIRRRLRATKIADFESYYTLLTSPAGVSELEMFLDAVTTNETHFFRTPHHFDWFKGAFLDELVLRPFRGRAAHAARLVCGVQYWRRAVFDRDLRAGIRRQTARLEVDDCGNRHQRGGVA